MINHLYEFVKQLERWERENWRFFWSTSTAVWILFCAIWNVTVIPSESFNTQSQNESVERVQQVQRGGGQNNPKNSFFVKGFSTTGNINNRRPSGTENTGIGSPRRKFWENNYNPKPRATYSLSASNNGNGNGNGNNGNGNGNDPISSETDANSPSSRNSDNKNYDKDFITQGETKKKEKREEEDLENDELNQNNTIIIEKFTSNAVQKVADTALNNNAVKNEYISIKNKLKTTHPSRIFSKRTSRVSADKYLIKGRDARVLVQFKQIEGGKNEVNILGVGSRSNKKNLNKFKNLMNDLYRDVNLQYRR
nr:hypothetical protein [Pseudo-nitzschia hainanensis]